MTGQNLPPSTRAAAANRATAAAHFARASALLSEGRLEEAVAAFAAALAADATLAEAHVNLGYIAQRQGRLEAARLAYERAIGLSPSFATAHFNLGNVFKMSGQWPRAAAAYREALRLNPTYVEAMLNLSAVSMLENRVDEAEALVRRAIELRPAFAEAHANLGDILLGQHRLAEALAACAQARRLGYDGPEVHLNEGYAHLLAGNLRLGWPKFEHRWAGANSPVHRVSSRPPWLGGEPVSGRTILVHADAGMGDMIQFARYVPLLVQRGATVHLEVPAPLVPLFSDLPFVAGVHRRDDPLPAFDLHTPFMSLPLAFDTQLETIPPPLMLQPSATRRAHWQAILQPARRPRVGVVWSGSPGHRADHNRSIPFGQFSRLTTALPEVEFFSLQHEIREGDVADLASHPEVVNLATHSIGAMDDTAAILAEMDLVVSVDTAIAHLAATMGRPVWLLLPHFPDWRWLLERTDTPWYPTMRLFRQPRRTDWDSVLQCVRAELETWIQRR